MTNFFEIALGKRTRSRQSSCYTPPPRLLSSKQSKSSLFAASATTNYTSTVSSSSSSYNGRSALSRRSAPLLENHEEHLLKLNSVEEEHRDDAESMARETVESIAEEYYQYNLQQQRMLRLNLQQKQQRRQRITTSAATTSTLIHTAYARHQHQHRSSLSMASSTISALSTTTSSVAASSSSSFISTSSVNHQQSCKASTTELIVLWDCASVPFSTNHAASLLTKSLGRKYGNVIHRRLYTYTYTTGRDENENENYNVNVNINASKSRSDALCGFEIVQTPTQQLQLLDNTNVNNNAINTLTTLMLVDMSSFVWDSACRGQRACVVVVTSNAEFAYGLARLRDRGIMIIVVFLNEDEICRELQGVADVCLLLEMDYRVAMPNHNGIMNHHHRKANHNGSIDSMHRMTTTTTTPPRYPKPFRKSSMTMRAPQGGSCSNNSVTGGSEENRRTKQRAPSVADESSLSSSFSLCRKKHENVKMIPHQPTVNGGKISDIQLICCCVHILQKARTKKMGGHGMSRAKETTVTKLFAAQTHDDSQVRYRANRNLAILDGYIHLGFIDQSIARDHVIVIEQPWEKNIFVSERLTPDDFYLVLTDAGRTLIHA